MFDYPLQTVSRESHGCGRIFHSASQDYPTNHYIHGSCSGIFVPTVPPIVHNQEVNVFYRFFQITTLPSLYLPSTIHRRSCPVNASQGIPRPSSQTNTGRRYCYTDLRDWYRLHEFGQGRESYESILDGTNVDWKRIPKPVGSFVPCHTRPVLQRQYFPLEEH